MIASLRNRWFEIFVISIVIFLGSVLSLRFVPGLNASVYSFISPSQVVAGEPIVIKSRREILTEKYNLTSGTPQFVLLSFDGSKSVDFLNETLSFSDDLKQKGIALNFTYFINMAYFLTKNDSIIYNPPRYQSGSSMIGFSEDDGSIDSRLKAFSSAIKKGHEIGSHTVGHFDGSGWSVDDWEKEFSEFNKILKVVQLKSGLTSSSSAYIDPTKIKGFRAPELGISRNLFPALKNFGFNYDTSEISRQNSWPQKDDFGIWHIPIGQIYLDDSGVYTIAMDYSIWQSQTFGGDYLTRNTEEWWSKHDELLSSYVNYFLKSYNSDQAPIIIGHHFSQWNDGLYWEVMKDFATSVCGKKQVYCVTYGELTEYLDEFKNK